MHDPAALLRHRVASTCWAPSVERNRLRVIRVHHVGFVRRAVERIGRCDDLAIEEPCAVLGVVAECDEVGPVCAARDAVLHRKVAALHCKPVVAVERIALAALVGAQHNRIVARGEPVPIACLFLEDQQWTRRWAAHRVVAPVSNDEQASPAAFDQRPCTENHRLVARWQLGSDACRQAGGVQRGGNSEEGGWQQKAFHRGR